MCFAGVKLLLLEMRCEACAGKCRQLIGLTSSVISDASAPGNVKLAFCKGIILKEFLLV